jgi:Flp pilus assembly pilin Flp
MNLLDTPHMVYLRARLGVRIQQLRAEERSLGASAIEWAIITGILATIAVIIGAVIYGKVQTASNNINVGDGGIGGR